MCVLLVFRVDIMSSLFSFGHEGCYTDEGFQVKSRKIVIGGNHDLFHYAH